LVIRDKDWRGAGGRKKGHTNLGGEENRRG
jgi:hypothetical protein